MCIYVHRYLSRARFVEDFVDMWKLQHDDAMFALDVEELIQECLDLASLCKHAWSFFRDRLVREPNGDGIEVSGEFMKKAVARTLDTFRNVRRLTEDSERKGHPASELSNFDIAENDVQAINVKLQQCFPPLDMEMVETSTAEFLRGEYFTSEELLRAAQNGNFPPG